jgi:hypothetical protein
MAQQSTIKSMRTVSAFLLLAVTGLITAAVVKIAHDYLLDGAELIGWALVPLALLLGFTLPVTCKARRTNSKECGHWAYGLLFGCRRVAGHWSGKFLFQLGLHRSEAAAATARRSKDSYVMHQPPPPQSKPIKVTVEENALAKCGFWVGLVSGIVGLTQALISLVH